MEVNLWRDSCRFRPCFPKCSVGLNWGVPLAVLQTSVAITIQPTPLLLPLQSIPSQCETPPPQHTPTLRCLFLSRFNPNAIITHISVLKCYFTVCLAKQSCYITVTIFVAYWVWYGPGFICGIIAYIALCSVHPGNRLCPLVILNSLNRNNIVKIRLWPNKKKNTGTFAQ